MTDTNNNVPSEKEITEDDNAEKERLRNYIQPGGGGGGTSYNPMTGKSKPLPTGHVPPPYPS